MNKFCAVAMTAALVLPVVATSAAAEGETITIEGLFYIDRNGDNAYNAGETVRANGPGVNIRVKGTSELVGSYPTGPDGRFRAVLPKGPTYVTSTTELDYSMTRLGYATSESKSDADYALRGIFLSGFTFVDTNGDGVKQADEKTHGGKVKVTGKANSGADVNVETEAAADGSYLLDLPLGDMMVNAPDLTAGGLALAQPKSGQDVDWLTGTSAVARQGSDFNVRIDLRYAEAKADIGLETAITPVKETYTRGDQIDLKLTLSNKGNVPVAPTFVLGTFLATLVSHSDNVKVQPGTDDDFTVVDKILPGKQIDVSLRIELNDLDYNEVHAMVRFGFGRLPDVNHKNNVAVKPIKVVAKGTSAEPSTPPSGTTTAAPTSTTVPAVAKAGNNSGLASTGASPLGFLGLGALLLAAGIGAFFVARRRRS